MTDWRSLLRTFLRPIVRPFVRRLSRGQPILRPGIYENVALSDKQIASGAYKAMLGGGGDQWDARGRYQLELLRHVGLTSDRTLLDVGCGPLRAGEHFIRFLNAGCYVGADYNASFVRIAQQIVRSGLIDKAPEIYEVHDFDFSQVARRFDFVLLFSVLNHCSPEQRDACLSNLGRTLSLGGTVIISHAGWLDDARLDSFGLRLDRLIEDSPVSIPANTWEQDELSPIAVLNRIDV